MLADKTRMDAYAYALKEVVTPDSVVLDIGTGMGIHALLACKFGARHVYAVESNDAIVLAQELAQENNFADRIEFIQGLSTEITLPEKADIIVSDLRGVLPLFGQHIPSIVDARQRHLAPGGVLLPKRDTLSAGLVEARPVYRNIVKPWDTPYGLTMNAAKKYVLNSWGDDDIDLFRPQNLLMVPQLWTELDYSSIENPHINGNQIVQQVSRDGTAHGVLMWFDAEIGDGIGFSNAPQSKKATDVYGRGFFPLLEPVPLEKGDTVLLDIRTELVDGQYIWDWHTRITSRGNDSEVKADFYQSTAKAV